MPLDSLQSRLVCCIANLKTARLAGLASEGMIMAAVQQQPDGSELVVPLQPHGDSGMLSHLAALLKETHNPDEEAELPGAWCLLSADLAPRL